MLPEDISHAQQRAKEAVDALEMAQRVVAESDMEIACIQRELHELEALGHATAVPAAPGSSLRMSRNRCSCPLTASTVLSSPTVDPKLVSLATAQSAELGEATRTSSRPTEETARETASESTTTHDGQNEDLEEARGGNKSRDERRDLGHVTEGSCDSTSRDTMIVATANVRTLHPKEEKEQVEVWRNNDAWESRTS